MLRPTDLRLRLAGTGLITIDLLSQQVGYAFTAGLPPLKASVVMMAAGAITLVLWVTPRNGLKLSQFDRPMRRLVLRLAFGNTIVSFSYLEAEQRLALGTVAAMMVLGTFSVGFSEIWRGRHTRWGIQHLAWRVFALAGVAIINRPLQGTPDVVGMFWAIVSAWCAWNCVSVIGRLDRQGLADQGACIANLVTVPVLAALVFVSQGKWWTSPHLLTVAGLAGVLTVCAPALLQNAAVRMVAPRELGVLLSLNLPIAALVAQVGAFLGKVNVEQRTSPEGWIAIAMIVTASICVSLVAERPAEEKPGHLTAAAMP